MSRKLDDKVQSDNQVSWLVRLKSAFAEKKNINVNGENAEKKSVTQPEEMDESYRIFEENDRRIIERSQSILMFIPIIFPVILIFRLLGLFQMSVKGLIILTVVDTLLLYMPVFINKVFKPSLKVMRYFITLNVGLAIGMLACNQFIGIYMTYGFMMVLSIFFYDKRFTLQMSVMSYVVIVVSLFFRSYNMVQVEYPTNRTWWISRSVGFLIETFVMTVVCTNLADNSRKMMIELNSASIERDEADRANKAKSDFLANMSHEIRTPLNAITGMSELILRETKEPTTETYANDIVNASKALLSIINDILDFSKIESGKLEIVNANYSLTSLINDVVVVNQVRAESKGLTFNVKVDPSLPEVLYGDVLRVRQVLVNIVSNAVKYTREGSVTFRVSGSKGKDGMLLLVVDVKDTGIGIKQEDIGKIFTMFERTDLEKNRTIEGTGLGLCISDRLVTAMGGSIGVNSEYGSGTDFIISLPQKIISDDKIGDYAGRLEYIKKARKQEQPTFKAPGAKVLVVDDTDMNRVVVKRLLKKTEVDVAMAPGGVEAIAMSAKEKFDIIFMDHMMPEMDGVEAMKRIKSDENSLNSDTPVICLTANAVAGMRERYLADGFNDYLTKPVSYAQLENMLRNYIEDKSDNSGDLINQAKGYKKDGKAKNVVKSLAERQPVTEEEMKENDE